jgi:hypothetical protein
VSRRGRPAADRLDLLDRCVDLLVADPSLAARPGELRSLLHAREADVRRLLRALRRIEDAELPPARHGRPQKCGRNPRRGVS